MIGSLRGTLFELNARDGTSAEALVEVSGVGYRVVVPAPAIERLGSGGSQVLLHVHTHVREDAIVLYGFCTREERACFELLIAAHGVGPAVALGLLAVHTPAALRRAVNTDDADALMMVPGIGKKTATRLILELKSKFEGDDDPTSVLHLVGSRSSGDATSATRADVRTALASLGYGGDEIRQALALVSMEETLEVQLKLALRELADVR